MTGASFLTAELPAITRLLRRMEQAPAPPAAIALFEAALPALPACGSAAPFLAAADAYAACDRPDGTMLLRRLAAQLSSPEPRIGARQAGAAAEVLAHPTPNACLLRHVAQRDGPDDAGAASLFEAVLADLPPLDEYWVLYRMAQIYARLGRDDAAFLLSALALQLEPEAEASERPARRVLARLVDLQAWAEAAALEAYWRAANPGGALLDPADHARLSAHAGVGATKREDRRERLLLAAEARPPMSVRTAGRALHHALHELQRGAIRPAITLTELDDAVLLIADGAVSVWTAEGTPLPELSVGAASGLMHLRLRARLARGEPVAERSCDAAVLIGDRFPSPNLCHFLLDQASRLELYVRAGLSLAEQVVIGPDLAKPYQHEIARRFGAQRYLGTRGHGLVRVRRLAVTSNCHHLRHSAHMGADWALQAIRHRFSDLLAGVRRQRRLFVSRADATSRRLNDESDILALVQPFGFEPITPGTLPLAAQVQAFAGATHVVAPHGAALANIAFCAPGTHVLEILHPQYGTAAYAMLAAPLDLDYVAMTGLDGDSDAPLDNDPALAAPRHDLASYRNLRADLPALRAWLQHV